MIFPFFPFLQRVLVKYSADIFRRIKSKHGASGAEGFAISRDYDNLQPRVYAKILMSSQPRE